LDMGAYLEQAREVAAESKAVAVARADRKRKSKIGANGQSLEELLKLQEALFAKARAAAEGSTEDS
jgi:hypothetical protein